MISRLTRYFSFFFIIIFNNFFQSFLDWKLIFFSNDDDKQSLSKMKFSRSSHKEQHTNTNIRNDHVQRNNRFMLKCMCVCVWQNGPAYVFPDCCSRKKKFSEQPHTHITHQPNILLFTVVWIIFATLSFTLFSLYSFLVNNLKWNEM